MPRSFAHLKAIRLERRVAALREQEQVRLPRDAHARHGVDRNQPRVPAGHSDGGQWTTGGTRTGILLAAADKPGPGPRNRAAEILLRAKELIEAYRSENGPWELFGRRLGTVTWTRFSGKDIFGSNSNSPTYTRVDRGAAARMRDMLIEKYPDVMKQDNIGEKPNDALFHAEATVLFRAARENGGTLTGRTLEVFADRSMCGSCRKVLPYVGLELGDPTVTFIDQAGLKLTMRNGAWVK
jgi:hypothetical protein